MQEIQSTVENQLLCFRKKNFSGISFYAKLDFLSVSISLIFQSYPVSEIFAGDFNIHNFNWLLMIFHISTTEKANALALCQE